jgi:hypothetical protein
MMANSRNSIRWGVATAVVALALGAIPVTFDADGAASIGKAALADAGGNGRLVAANPKPLPGSDAMGDQEKMQPASAIADDADDLKTTGADQPLVTGDDGDRIEDDSDVASVDRSANDRDAEADGVDPVATAAKITPGASGDYSGESF